MGFRMSQQHEFFTAGARRTILLFVGVIAAGMGSLAADAADKVAPDYVKQIAPIFQKRCVGCHNADDAEGKLSLDSYADLQKGGKHGPSFQPGDIASSRLLQLVTGKAKPVMPPEDEERLTKEEIALLIAWVETGAKGPDGKEPTRRTLMVPKIAVAENAEGPIAAVAVSPDGSRIAVARFASVEIRDAASMKVVQRLTDFPGKVNSIEFSTDGARIIAGSGIAGLYGQASIWTIADGKQVAMFEGHRDSMYDAVLNRDQSVLATASYDKKIILWDVATGKELRTLLGHNGAVFDLDFSPDGTIVASASADQTIKLWQVSTGVRLDTLSQPLKDQYVVRFSPDGQHVIAGGLDNRIRVWKVVSRTKPQINPLVYSRIAAEGSIIQLGFSPDGSRLVSIADDQTMKLWDTAEYTQKFAFDAQPSVTPALTLASNGKSFVVGRINGTLQKYDLSIAARSSAAATHSQLVTVFPTADKPSQSIDEAEPNDNPAQASVVEIPATIKGAINPGSDNSAAASAVDVDMFRFSANAGEAWVFEVNAARNKSLLDSKIEILDADGNRIERVRLQAVRDSYIQFRGINTDTRDCRLHNWEEMDVNQLLYLNGEVVQLWLWPRGPDSGFQFYPQTGNRTTLFDTTPHSHALQEPCYIVEPHPPGTELIPNGLPAFPIYYENDDDALRQLGKDSRLTFTAPVKGDYFVRVSDVRGASGADFKYELTARPAKPDFNIRLQDQKPSVQAGSGKEFKLMADRLDGFKGEIHIAIENVPAGFEVSQPLVIEAGQFFAYATINAAPDAKEPTPEDVKKIKFTAKAMVNGQEVAKDVGSFAELKLAAAPKVLVAIGPDKVDAGDVEVPAFGKPNPLELTIAPGETITARVRIARNEYDGRVGFEAIAHNLPHGIIVDNVGLSGLLIVEGKTQRQFFLTAADWVPEQTRVFHLRSKEEGGQTSWPIILHVRRK
ncbi:MAG: mono/diheme cytochrome c family protein [Planctomycetaceae bacterium]|jgi:mono/diheme cytochrome c family protein